MIAPADRCPTTAALVAWIALVAPELTGDLWTVIDVQQTQAAAGEPALPYAAVEHSSSKAGSRPGVRQTSAPAPGGRALRIVRQQWDGTALVHLHGPGAWYLAHHLHLTLDDPRVRATLAAYAVEVDPGLANIVDRTELRDDATWLEVMELTLNLRWETRLERPSLTIETLVGEVEFAGSTRSVEVPLAAPAQET